MFGEYVEKALEKACYKRLDNGDWFAEISGFSGVWANGKTVELCRRELKEVLEEWLLLKMRDGDSLPEVEGCSLEIKEAAA